MCPGPSDRAPPPGPHRTRKLGSRPDSRPPRGPGRVSQIAPRADGHRLDLDGEENISARHHQPRAPGTPLGYVGAPAPRHVSTGFHMHHRWSYYTMLYTYTSLFYTHKPSYFFRLPRKSYILTSAGHTTGTERRANRKRRRIYIHVSSCLT
jgi:hypothetical protein